MIDWVTCKIRFPHSPLPAGQVISMTPDGEIEWTSLKRLPVEGSHSAKTTIRSMGSVGPDHAEFISISGNPSKFLQGHNCFGSDDLLALVYDQFVEISKRLNFNVDQATLVRVKKGDYEVSRVDINNSYTLRNQRDVLEWISAAEMKSRSRNGRPAAMPGTIYWGKHSRKWAIKAYSKLNELTNGPKDQRLKDSLGSNIPRLLEWCENILRVELCLRTTELKKIKLTRAADLAKQVPALYAEYKGRILMNDQRRISSSKLMELPNGLRPTYQLWSEGHRMIDLMTRPTFYRHRKALLNFGVDISINCDLSESSNVVPFIRELEAIPAQFPTWAFADNLLHKSAYAR